MTGKNLLTGFFLLFIAACATRPLFTEPDNLTISRDPPANNCRSLGPVQGRVSDPQGTLDDAMKDLKKSASVAGANFVRLEKTSALGSAVMGEAFDCP